MKKRRVISLSISLILLVIGIVVAFQLYPYMNLRNCDVDTQFTLMNGSKIIIYNRGDSVAKFPKTYFSIYRNDIYVGDASIPEITIQPHHKVEQDINLKLKITMNQSAVKLLKTNETKINGTIFIPFLSFEIPIKFKMEKPDNGKATIWIWGRKIER